MTEKDKDWTELEPIYQAAMEKAISAWETQTSHDYSTDGLEAACWAFHDHMTENKKIKRTRVHQLKAKAGELKAGWGRGSERGDGPDIAAAWQHPAQKSDMNLLLGWLSLLHPFGSNVSFTEELKLRGYDLTTLKFSIQKKIE